MPLPTPRHAFTHARFPRHTVAVTVASLVAATLAHAAPARVEVQVALCADAATVERALHLAPREAPYETWLFDDAHLALLEHGLRLRMRMRDRGAELTLKAAVAACDSLPPDLVPRREGKCEFDAHGDAIGGAVSLTTPLDAQIAARLAAGTQPVAAVLSPAQQRLLRETTSIWPLPADLRPLGPVANRVLATADERYDVDVQTLPDGAAFIEISRKVRPKAAAKTRTAMEAMARAANVPVCADQAGQAATKLRALQKGR